MVRRFNHFLQSYRHGFVVVQLKPQPPTFSPDINERAPHSHEPSKCLIHVVTLIRFSGHTINIKSLRLVGGNNFWRKGYAVTMYDSLLTQSVCGRSPSLEIIFDTGTMPAASLPRLRV